MYLSSGLILLLIAAGICVYYYTNRDRLVANEYSKRRWLSKRKIRYYRDNNVPDNPINTHYYNYLISKYYKSIFYSSNINKRFPAEEDFINDLGLCWRLLKFIEDIRYYPLWNQEKVRKDSGVIFTSWYSAEMRNSVTSRKCAQSKVYNLFSSKLTL